MNIPLRILIAITFLLLMRSFASAQQFNVYEDALENGWQNYSWCKSDLASHDFIYSGSTSIKVSYTAGWQALYFHCPESVPIGYFQGIEFYISGGLNNGRKIVVQATVGGAGKNSVNLENYVDGGSIRSRIWKRVFIPNAALGLSSSDQIDGFWLQDSSGQAQPAFYVDQIRWIPNSVPSSISITCSPRISIRKVDARVFGVNTAVWDTNLDSPTIKSRLAEAGFQFLRFPGGSLSDGYNWKTNTTDKNTWTWATNFDQFADLANTQHANVVLTANYGTGTAQLAADWVAYNKAKGYNFKYWEIGNEVYGTWEEDGHSRKNDPYTYAQQFAAYYQAMKAQDPTIKIGAVATSGEDAFANYTDHPAINPITHQSHNGWTPVMLATLAKLGVTPDFLDYHRYPMWQGNESDFLLLLTNSSLFSEVIDLRSQLKAYLGAAGANVEILNTENNSQAGVESKQMTSIVNGLYLADTFGNVLKTELNGFMWWDLLNGKTSSGNNGSWLYGWRLYGDEGLITPETFERYPAFYIEKLLSKFASPGDSVIPVSSSYGLLSVFGVAHSDGSVRLLVINKRPDTALSAQFAFTSFTRLGSCTVQQYGIDQDEAARTGIGSPDIITKTLPYAPNGMSISFPPYSASVVTFSPTRL